MESFEERVLLAIGRIEGHMSFVNERVKKLEYRQNWLKALWTALAGDTPICSACRVESKRIKGGPA